MDESLLHAFRRLEAEHWWFRARGEILVGLVEQHLAPGSRVLDIGCGTGFFLEALKDRFEIAGLDPSAQAVSFCRARGLATVDEGGTDDLSRLPQEAFDGIALLDVIEHLDDDVQCLRSSLRLLKPGGYAFITVPAYEWLWTHHDDLNQHRRRYTVPRLRASIERAGLESVLTSYFNTRLFPIAAPARLVMRLLRMKSGAGLGLPPGPVNRAFYRLFAGEARQLSRHDFVGYRFGLSALAVARRPAGSG